MKTFIIEYQNLETRLDVDFYNPLYTKLENIIKSKTNTVLGDYIVELSGGATPPKNVQSNYSDSKNGIPFLRVQNIKEAGLDLSDVRYISKETHNNKLKRSQLNEGDLVVTITGRIASSTVIPNNFIGNINQHSVRIKTKNKESAYVIATYLNSSVGQKLALRRTTGGTRPALDYKALKSIPVVFNPKIVNIMQSAYQKKQELEQEAEKLAKNNYKLLLEKLSLNFALPEQEKAFAVSVDDIVENRIDPMFYSNVKNYIIQTITDSKYTVKPLGELIIGSLAGYWGNDETKKKENEIAVNVVRNTNFDNKINLNLENIAVRYVEPSRIENRKLSKGDLLIEKSGGSPAQPVGRVCLWDKDFPEDYIFSNFLQKISIDQEQCLPEYLFVYLRALYSIGLMEYFQNQTTGIKNLIWEEFVGSPIILPTLGVQRELAEFVLNRNKEIIKLEEKAETILEQAKAQVEEILLNR